MICGMSLVDKARAAVRGEAASPPPDYTTEDALKLFRKVFGEGNQNETKTSESKTPPR
jgi:hypothetical protein